MLNKKYTLNNFFPPLWLLPAIIVFISGCALSPSTRTTMDGATGKGSELGIVFDTLEKEGYKPNIGFSAKFSPGSIIQVTKRDNKGNIVQEKIPGLSIERLTKK